MVSPEVGLFTAISRALIIVLPFSLLVVFSRTATFIGSLALIGWLLNDSNGIQLNALGAILWMLGGIMAFVMSLSYYSRFIAPPFNEEINSTSFLAFRLLLQTALKEFEYNPRPIRHIPGNIAQSFNTIRAGLIPRDKVYAVYQGRKFRYGVGPGYWLLQPKERIVTMYNTIPQKRSIKVEVTTRDGIKSNTTVGIGFRIRPPVTNPEPRLHYPYAKRAIRELQYANTVTIDGAEQTIHPFDQVMPRAEIFVAEEISRLTLDEILRVNEPGANMLGEIGNRVKEKMNSFFAKKGVQIDSCSLSGLDLDPSIQRARLEAWKGGWKRPLNDRKVGSKLNRVSPEAARQQFEVIQDLMDNLKTYYEAGGEYDVPMRDEIMARVEAVVTEAATEGLIKALIPDPD